MVLLAIALTSLLVARSFEEAQRPIQHILWGGMFLTAITFHADSTRKVRMLLLAASIAFACSVLVLLLRVLRAGGLFLLQPTGEPRMGVGDPNFTAIVACAFLIPLAHVMGHMRLRGRLVLVPVLLLHVAVVILSASRMGMALMALTLFVLVLRARRARPYAVFGLVVLGVVRK